MERAGFMNTMKDLSKRTEKIWNRFIKPGLKIVNPKHSAGVAARTKNAKAGERTSNNSKSLTGGIVLESTHLH